MTKQTQVDFRHSLRPLSVFSFCGQPIAAPRGDYLWATRYLSPCMDCLSARNGAALAVAPKRRGASTTVATGSSARAYVSRQRLLARMVQESMGVAAGLTTGRE